MDNTNTNAQQKQPLAFDEKSGQWQPATDNVSTTESKSAAPSTINNLPIAISIVLALLNIVLSASTYYSMAFGSGPWTEGRVFGYLIGYIDIPILLIIFVLNAIATAGTLSSNKAAPNYTKHVIYNLSIWVLWGILGLLAYMILTFDHTSV